MIEVSQQDLSTESSAKGLHRNVLSKIQAHALICLGYLSHFGLPTVQLTVSMVLLKVKTGLHSFICTAYKYRSLTYVSHVGFLPHQACHLMPIVWQKVRAKQLSSSYHEYRDKNKCEFGSIPSMDHRYLTRVESIFLYLLAKCIVRIFKPISNNLSNISSRSLYSFPDLVTIAFELIFQPQGSSISKQCFFTPVMTRRNEVPCYEKSAAAGQPFSWAG